MDEHLCYGHNSKNIQPFHDLFQDPSVPENASSQEMPKTYYTNEELYDLLRPDGEAAPYMYDNFQWEHCAVSHKPATFLEYSERIPPYCVGAAKLSNSRSMHPVQPALSQSRDIAPDRITT